MNRSIRTLGLAVGAAALFSGASASAALASNPINISVQGNTLVINDPTGVTQATKVTSSGAGFEIEEFTSGNVLEEGSGVTATIVWSDQHWYVDVGSATITRVAIYGGGGGDLLNTADVTGLPVSVLGEAGADYIVTGAGNDVVNGGADSDVILAGAGADLINGGTGSDNIKGEVGDDQIVDKDGFADTVDGGNDYDTFRRDVGLDTATNIELYS